MTAGPLVAAEFFAGIGLVRLGLESAGFQVRWSNDWEPAKALMYRGEFPDPTGSHHFTIGDIAAVAASDLPAGLSLAWASFPCTDLSLAGARRGLAGAESSTFYEFIRLLDELGDDRPPVVALENVVGLATSRQGEDLRAAIAALNLLGYAVDVLAIDARRFVAQSRPRLFLIGAKQLPSIEQRVDSTSQRHELRPALLDAVFDDPDLHMFHAPLPPAPELLTTGFGDLIEVMADDDERWWEPARVAQFTGSLSAPQESRLRALRAATQTSYRTAYRRTRGGLPVWEVRADDIAGCLRTPRGGSSRQAVVEAGFGKVRVRWMTGLEYARLMGAGDYELRGLRTSQVIAGFGDAVCVPVVAWLARTVLLPLTAEQRHLVPSP